MKGPEESTGNTLEAAEGDRKNIRSRSRSRLRRWIRLTFLTWAAFAFLYLGNSVRTQGVAPEMLQSSSSVEVWQTSETLTFRPEQPKTAGVIFLCGSGISSDAYAPLLRPVADGGWTVVVVSLPWRFAPLEAHRDAAVARVTAIPEKHPHVANWVVAGHSLGGALACRVAVEHPGTAAALLLVGTTHPKETSLSQLEIPVSKVYGSADRIAPPVTVEANRTLLPAHTRMIKVDGANHSQFGHYGHQLLDGHATLPRNVQQASVREELLHLLHNLSNR